jgi:hypothetical protein
MAFNLNVIYSQGVCGNPSKNLVKSNHFDIGFAIKLRNSYAIGSWGMS